MVEITTYHWVWYLIGFICLPKLTLMIFISLYFPHFLPLPLFIFGWIYAVLPTINFSKSVLKK